MSRKELSLRENQLAALDILKKVIKICEELNITYWITYGTLLGAVRHGGFIPWDDDLDIAMKREDYEIFVEYMEKNEKILAPLKIHNKHTVKNCFYNISRICDTRYMLEFVDYDYCSGAFIDVYPYEGLGSLNEKMKWENWFRRNTFYKRFVNLSCAKRVINGKNLISKILNFPLFIYSKYRGNVYFLNKMDEYSAFDWDTSDFIGVPCWGAAIYKNYYKEFVDLKFEDIYVKAPKEYDAILREAYGDYMQYPPEDRREPYHGYYAYCNFENKREG